MPAVIGAFIASAANEKYVRVDGIVMPIYTTNYWYYRNLSAMSKNTSITLGKRFESFVAEQIKNGRYASTSELVRAGLRLLEEEEAKLATLRKMLDEGEASDFVEYSLNGLIDELNGESH